VDHMICSKDRNGGVFMLMSRTLVITRNNYYTDSFLI